MSTVLKPVEKRICIPFQLQTSFCLLLLVILINLLNNNKLI